MGALGGAEGEGGPRLSLIILASRNTPALPSCPQLSLAAPGVEPGVELRGVLGLRNTTDMHVRVRTVRADQVNARTITVCCPEGDDVPNVQVQRCSD